MIQYEESTAGHRFACPECGGDKIEVINNDAIAVTPITGLEKYKGNNGMGYEPVYDTHSTVITEVFGTSIYACAGCGHVICKGRDEDLVMAMREHGWIEER